MKHFVSLALIVCFVSCMVSCGSPKIEKENNSDKEVSAITELDSSSLQMDLTTTFFERTALTTLNSISAAEATFTQTEVSSENPVITTAAKPEQTTKKETKPTTYIETTGQIVEKPIEETVTKERETATIVETTITVVQDNNYVGIDSYSYQLLAELIEHEAGCSWINTYDKAHIAAAVMNRVYDARFPDTVYDNLIDQSQFPGYYPGCIVPSASAYEALDYYLAHSNEFDNSNSWFGDGTSNYFYFQ
jgi:hypothetical protein